MATGGVLGHGIKVAYSSTSPTSWTSVGQILDTDLPGLEPDEVETTVHGTNPYRRFIRGLIDVSEFTMNLLLDMDTANNNKHFELFNLQKDGTTLWWRIEVPADDERTEYWAMEFQAWVKNWKPGAPIDDKQTLDTSLRFDGTDFAVYQPAASAI